MKAVNPRTISGCILAILILPMPAASAEIPDAIAAPGEALVATVHAQGAQVYECVLDPSGKLAWQFREPIATLLIDGKTVGRHYAGPTWEMSDGSAVGAKVSARAPGAAPGDIPFLKLEPENSTASPRSKDSTRAAAAPKARVTRPAHSSAFPTRPTTLSTKRRANHIELANGG